MQSLFEERLYVLVELGLAQKNSDNLDDMFDAIKNAFNQATLMVKDVDAEQLRIEQQELNFHIQSIDSELKEIEEALKKVEDLVLNYASIVDTTLTSASLKDSIQIRRF